MGLARCAGYVRDGSGATAFLARGELYAAAKSEGSATLSVALYGDRGDALRSALAAWDERPMVQVLGETLIDGFRERWGPQGAPPRFDENRSAPHVSRDGGLAVDYEVAAGAGTGRDVGQLQSRSYSTRFG